MNMTETRAYLRERINKLTVIMSKLKGSDTLSETYWLYDARLNELQTLLKHLNKK